MVEGEVRPGRAVNEDGAGRIGWGGSIATAIGVAAAVGAAQLGLGYGLEIISWRAGGGRLASDAWLASLAWATWIAATSTIAGAVVAERLGTGPRTGDPAPATGPPDQPSSPVAPPHGPPTQEPPPGEPHAHEPAGSRGGDRFSRGLWRLVLAAAAALGGSITVALSAVPARLAEPAETSSPQTVAAGYAIVGVLVGLLVAVGALAARAVAANVVATAAWLWVLAVVAVVDGVLAGLDFGAGQGGGRGVPLAFWVFTEANPGQRWGITAGGPEWFGNIFLPDAGLAAGAALVIGALAALPAARRGEHPVGVAVSGAVGPLVVAAAYLLAQPDLAGAGAVDISRHLVAPYLVVTGLIGSLLISAVRPRSRRRATIGSDPDEPRPADPTDPADAGPADPADAGPADPAVPAPRGEPSELTRTP